MDCLPVEVTCEAQVGLWVGVLMSVGTLGVGDRVGLVFGTGCAGWTVYL